MLTRLWIFSSAYMPGLREDGMISDSVDGGRSGLRLLRERTSFAVTLDEVNGVPGILELVAAHDRVPVSDAFEDWRWGLGVLESCVW